MTKQQHRRFHSSGLALGSTSDWKHHSWHNSPAPLLIIPAAGLGTRVGSPPAKELLLSPRTQMPLICFWLVLAQKYQLPIHIISRSDKTALNNFLRHWQQTQYQNIELQLLDHLTGEWPTTVLRSATHWKNHNILCLPDTEFNSTHQWEKMLEQIHQFELTVLTFTPPPDEKNLWGMVNCKNQQQIFWCEKPQYKELQDQFDHSWGLLAFHKNIGLELFSKLEKSTQTHELQKFAFKTEEIRLEFFQDLTRVSPP